MSLSLLVTDQWSWMVTIQDLIRRSWNRTQLEGDNFWSRLETAFSVRISCTCCRSRDQRWRWGRRSPQRQSRELSCCGTATSGREKQTVRRLVIVTVIEMQEKSKQKWEWQEGLHRQLKKKVKRKSSTLISSVSFLPGTVWVHFHSCWSARDSNLHQRLRYRTTWRHLESKYQILLKLS